MIKKMLKSISWLVRWKNNYIIKKKFHEDYIFYKKHWIGSKQQTNKKLGYSIILEAHSIEKGMTSANPRRFGVMKVKKIIECLEKYSITCDEDKDYFYKLGYGALNSYCDFYKKNNWIETDEYKLVANFIKKHNNEYILVGAKMICKEEFIDKALIDYKSFLSSRHSNREFEKKPISVTDFNEAVSMALLSPTACNRQMCKIYYVKNKDIRDECIKYGHGLTNFDIESCNIFVITYDESSFCYYGDRHQGWLNTGLVAMNFVNALHSLGIGSCFIQYGNDYSEEEEMKKLLEIPANEKISLMIASGYYKEKTLIPLSTRKSTKDISRII